MLDCWYIQQAILAGAAAYAPCQRLAGQTAPLMCSTAPVPSGSRDPVINLLKASRVRQLKVEHSHALDVKPPLALCEATSGLLDTLLCRLASTMTMAVCTRMCRSISTSSASCHAASLRSCCELQIPSGKFSQHSTKTAQRVSWLGLGSGSLSEHCPFMAEHQIAVSCGVQICVITSCTHISVCCMYQERCM
jgi:hypothetical protein